MVEPILATKLYIPPLRTGHIPRPQLVKRLRAGLSRQLTLISAPAGFGKTTLVSEWVLENRARVAWLSLDEGDNDPTRFFAHLVAAVDSVYPQVGDVLGMLESPQPPPPQVILTRLLNAIASTTDKLMIVLDDYHVIQHAAIDHALTFLLDHQPPMCHVVMVTREDPLLPLARLRARGQLSELRAADLRFSVAECGRFLNEVMRLDLSTDHVAVLEQRTEGWIAGLQLAGISIQGHQDPTTLIKSFSGSHRFIIDYLIEEVLERQPDSVQQFLLATAILNQLKGALCDALTEQSDGQATLEMLERANLFIVALDQDREWYRYHHLFAELLRQRLRQTQPDQVAILHQRASAWYEQQGFITEAIEHALQADAFDRAAHLIDSVAEAIWKRGEHGKLQHWLTKLPPDTLHANPQLGIFLAWVLLADGQIEPATMLLQAAEDNLLAQVAASPLHGRLATTNAFASFYRSDVAGIMRYASQALELLPAEDVYWRNTATHILGDGYDFQGKVQETYQARLEAVEANHRTGNHFQNLIVQMKLAINLRQQGRMQGVIDLCEQQYAVANQNGMGQTIVAGWLLLIWAEALAEINDRQAAMEYAKQGIEIVQRGGDFAILGSSYLLFMRVLFSQGAYQETEDAIYYLEQVAQQNFMPPWVMLEKEAWKVRLWIVQHKMDLVAHWMTAQPIRPDAELSFLVEVVHMAQGRILIAQGQWQAAIILLRRLLTATKTDGRIAREIEIRILLALAYTGEGDTPHAMRTLAQALSLAEPRGMVRTFVDEGAAVAQLLHQTVQQGITPAYSRRLLTAFPPSDTPTVALIAGVEALSEREIEVLQLIAEGLTNHDIGRRLFLSRHTIKVHTRNIYQKLDVHTRTQAVAKARTLGILPAF